MRYRNSGGIGKTILSVLEISLNPREISWASGMDFPIPPEFWWNVSHCENEDVIVIFSVAIHPDGLYIAAGFGDKIRLLNILIGSNSKLLFTL